MPKRCPDGRCRERCHGRNCRPALLAFRPPEEFSMDPGLLRRLDRQIAEISEQLVTVATQLERESGFSLALDIEAVPTVRGHDDDPEDVVVPVIRPIRLISPDGDPGLNVTSDARDLLTPPA
jgi:hypothetical protein